MINQYKEQAEFLKEILELNREVTAVKFLKDLDQPDSWQNYDQVSKMRYCQALMSAGDGSKVLLSSKNISCAAAGAAFGLMPLHPKLASGEGHFNSGVFGSPETASKIMGEMPRFEQETYKYIAIAPLGAIDWIPDIIAIEAGPEAIMWLSLAVIYHTGERLQFSTSVVQATCVDAGVLPMLNGKANGSFGCTGCREATDLRTTEALIGLPGSELEPVLQNLKILSETVIPKNRNKSIHKKFSGIE